MKLADLAGQFADLRRASGLLLGDDTVVQCAIDATRYYAGCAELEAFEVEGAPEQTLEAIDPDLELQPSEWALIRPLFLLYVERESAIVADASRGLGVEMIGRDSATVAADIQAYERELPQLAYVEDAWSIGFPPEDP